MGREQDLRYIRTRQMIKTAFFELVSTVGFDKITVQNLSEKAMINRSTFYLHYTDKFDLLDKIEDEAIGDIMRFIEGLPIESFGTKQFDIERALAVFSHIYEYISENRSFFQSVMTDKGNPSFFQKFSTAVKSVIRRNMILHVKTNIPEHYLAALIAGAQTGLIGEWLSGGMKETPEEMAAIITSVGKRVAAGLDPA